MYPLPLEKKRKNGSCNGQTELRMPTRNFRDIMKSSTCSAAPHINDRITSVKKTDCHTSSSETDCTDENSPVPTPMERYHMLALGRFFKREDVLTLLKKCRKGVWTEHTLQEALDALDTQDPINEHESREIVHIRNLVDHKELMSINSCFNGAVRKAPFQPGTDSGKTASWCKYLYIKSRKTQHIPEEFQSGLSESLQRRVHAEVKKTLNIYESDCFDKFFPGETAREISVVVRLMQMNMTCCCYGARCIYDRLCFFVPRCSARSVSFAVKCHFLY